MPSPISVMRTMGIPVNIDYAGSVMVAELSIGHVDFTPIMGELVTGKNGPVLPATISRHIIRVGGSFVLHGDNLVVDGVLCSADTRAPSVMQTYGLHFVSNANPETDVIGARKLVAVGIVVRAWEAVTERFLDWEERSLCVTVHDTITLMKEGIRDTNRRIISMEHMASML